MAFLQKRNGVYSLCEKIRKDGKWTAKWIRLGKISAIQAKAVLLRYESDQTYLRIGVQADARLTLADLIREYEDFQTCTPTKKRITVEREKDILRLFARKFGDVPIAKLSHQSVTAWFHEKNYQPSSVIRFIATIRQVYKYALKEGYLKLDPLAEIHRPKQVRKPPRYATEEAIQAVFSALADTTRPVYQIMYYAGLRPSEALRLKVENIDIKRKLIDLQPDQTKTAERGILPIHPKLIPIFQRLIRGKSKSDFLFPAPGGIGHQVDSKKALINACRRAGVWITPYQFRHSFATHVLERTGDIRAVQQLMRHTDIRMTTRYATTVEQKLRDAVDKL